MGEIERERARNLTFRRATVAETALASWTMETGIARGACIPKVEDEVHVPEGGKQKLEYAGGLHKLALHGEPRMWTAGMRLKEATRGRHNWADCIRS